MKPGEYLRPQDYGGGPGESPVTNRRAIAAALDAREGGRVLLSAGTWDVCSDAQGRCLEIRRPDVTLEAQGKLRLVHPVAARKPALSVLRILAPRVTILGLEIDGNALEQPAGAASIQALVELARPDSGPDAVDARLDGCTLNRAAGIGFRGVRDRLRLSGLRISRTGGPALLLRPDGPALVRDVALRGCTIVRPGLDVTRGTRLGVLVRQVVGCEIVGGLVAIHGPRAGVSDVGVSVHRCRDVTLRGVAIQGAHEAVRAASSREVRLVSVRGASSSPGGVLCADAGVELRGCELRTPPA